MFLNCTAHELTIDQINESKKYSAQLCELKTIDSNLHKDLLNCPSEMPALQTLCNRLMSFLEAQNELSKQSSETMTVHFPIGSPIFMALFFLKWDKDRLPMRIVFSHSERQSIDEKQSDGSIVKKAVFLFVRFIELVV